MAQGIRFLDRFAEVISQKPSHVALRHDDATMTFAELDIASREVAAALHRRGVGARARVVIQLEHSTDLVVAVVAVLRSGAAFVPIDHRHNDARATGILQAAEPDLVIRPGDVEVAELRRSGAASPGTNAAPAPESPAYVLYTSGSTGAPKGVVIAHRGLDSHLAWAVERYLSHGPHGAPLYSSVGFDLTITSLLAPIAASKTIDIIPADRGIQGVADELAEGRSYDLLKLTPSHLRLLTTALEQRAPRGRVACLVVGGEALPAELLRLWRRISPASIIVNSYGPTETTVSCCTHTVWPGDPIPDPVPIGTATPGVDLRIVDGQGIAVPAGEAGELLIGGIGVADGYLGRPGGLAMTDQRLRVNPIECKAHGICAELLPEMIALDEWGYPILSPQPIPGRLAGHARRAAAACPRLALRLAP